MTQENAEEGEKEGDDALRRTLPGTAEGSFDVIHKTMKSLAPLLSTDFMVLQYVTCLSLN